MSRPLSPRGPLAPVLLCLLFCGACTSMGGSDQETVVQKSSFVAPDWVRDEAPGVTAKDAYLHYIKTDSTRLELGIRQANAAAIEDTKRLFQIRLQKELDRAALRVLGRKAKDIGQQIEEAVAAAMSRSSPTDAQPRSVYWEEIQRNTPEGPRNSFRIHVLAAVPRAELDVAMDLAARKLAESAQPDAKRLGSEIIKEYSGGAPATGP